MKKKKVDFHLLSPLMSPNPIETFLLWLNCTGPGILNGQTVNPM